ncbi:MAG: hypothetical protein AVDCRST_MAG75-641 [uncultured Propionibacteriaceae bacterium]|uniref:Uncharacterized protein n=1 Tax=uncultured Propionibacteriaceae bacterium TaxID=257457 RepID=A0A6J4N406_9ACTN|nr:MAG: hypothetical protein AVDCRST_MAG75-641 [uncultured Propionibacteriaceae bacterium]
MAAIFRGPAQRTAMLRLADVGGRLLGRRTPVPVSGRESPAG